MRLSYFGQEIVETDLAADMQAALIKLKAMQSSAASIVNGTSSFVGASNSRDAARASIKQYGVMIQDLAGADRDRVLAKESQPAWWFKKAALIGEGITYTVRDVGNWGMGSVVSKWANATWAETKALAPSKTELFAGLGLVAVIVGGIAVLKVASLLPTLRSNTSNREG